MDHHQQNVKLWKPSFFKNLHFYLTMGKYSLNIFSRFFWNLLPHFWVGLVFNPLYQGLQTVGQIWLPPVFVNKEHSHPHSFPVGRLEWSSRDHMAYKAYLVLYRKSYPDLHSIQFIVCLHLLPTLSVSFSKSICRGLQLVPLELCPQFISGKLQTE